MTVVPQRFTLHCVSIGDRDYTITLYGNDLPIYNNINCKNGDCVREELHSSNNTYDNTVNITWDTQTISGGELFNQSVNDDQMYTCKVTAYDTKRNHTLTIRGIKIISYISSI